MMKRRIAAIVFLSLACAVAVYAAVVLDKHNGQDNGGSGNANISVTLTATAAGSIVVCAVGENASGGNSFNNVTDNVNGGAYSIASAAHTIATVNQIVVLAYKENNAGGTVIVTAHYNNSGTFGALLCGSFTGVMTSGSLDVAATPRDATSTNPACNAMVTTANGDLIFAAVSTVNFIPTNGAGFSALDTAATTFFVNEYQVQSTAGSITPGFTQASSDTYGCIAAAFKATVAGGTQAGSQHGGNHASGGNRKVY